jgi:DNA-directed RNA polymerase subunit D
MEIKVLELMENRMKFLVSDATPETVNAIRRTLMSDIPKMAIENVDMHLGPISDDEGNEYESVTPLFDEIIGHRLGMIPVPTDLSLFTYKDECTCEGEGCPNCTIMYSLNKKGPGDVFSGDMEPLGSQEFRVKDELIPIVKLGEGQAILIYASAELGTARRHAKWQVTNGVGFKFYPSVEIDKERCDNGGSCIRICPHDVLEKIDGDVQVVDLEACDSCRSCVDVCDTKAISVSSDDTKFIFEFETDGSLSATTALDKALEILEQRFEVFREQVSELEG